MPLLLTLKQATKPTIVRSNGAFPVGPQLTAPGLGAEVGYPLTVQVAIVPLGIVTEKARATLPALKIVGSPPSRLLGVTTFWVPLLIVVLPPAKL